MFENCLNQSDFEYFSDALAECFQSADDSECLTRLARDLHFLNSDLQQTLWPPSWIVKYQFLIL